MLKIGFTYIWDTQTFNNNKWLVLNVKQILQNQFIQSWASLVGNSPKAVSYRLFKAHSELQKYFFILDRNFIYEFCRYRTLNHKLPIEYGRWQNVERNRHICTLCNKATNFIILWTVAILITIERLK